ncbi:MAG: FtsX-like permease family protein [Ruminococcaceae bacterium]|nr:FtsX-like permease family protein [Oscillospiraceae bacterium]
MEFIFEYLKTNIKYAAKSVFRKFKEYLPFFAVLFVILCVFFTIFISTATNAKNNAESLSEQLDYDVMISGFDEKQKLAVERDLYIQSYMKKRSFESYTIEQASDIEGGDYRVYLVMREDSDLDFFVEQHIYNPIGGEDPDITVSTTPRYDYKMSSASSDSPPLLLIAAMCAISVAALVAIYSIRVNNQKFMYGIYITFGANLKKLISTSVFEMMLIAFLAYIPAALLSYLFSFITYGLSGITPVINLGIFIKVLVSIFVISLVGTYLPMKSVSRKTPLSLLSSDDNANLVISPSRSVDMLKSSFPKKYEFLSLFRFRKYYIKLVLSSVIFTSVFICGFYISSMYNTNLDAPIPEFSFVNRAELEEDEQINDIEFLYSEIGKIDNVESVSWNVDVPASRLGSVALIKKEQRTTSSVPYALIDDIKCLDEEMNAKVGSYADSGFVNAINTFEYSAFGESSVDYIEERFEVEGDLRSIFNTPNTVIVSEDVYNENSFDFEVGDKIIIGKLMQNLKQYDGDYSDTVGVVRHFVQSNVYEYREYTVGAVIKNYGDSEGRISIGMNYDEFRYMTGSSAAPSEVFINLSADTAPERADEISSELATVFYYMGSNYKLSRSYATVERDILREEHLNTLAIMLSSLVVIMSPVVWFFSQAMFTEKRKKELFVLRAFGAKEREISNIFSCSGGVMATVGFVLATLLSLPASYLIYKTMNSWLPSLGFIKDGIKYTFALSPVAIIICALLSAACGFLSALVPYKLSLRAEKKLQERINNEGGNK